MKIKLMIFRRYFLIVLLTFPFVASAQLFRPLNLGFNGGERQGTWECLTEFVYGNPAATAIGFHPARSNIIYNSGEGLIYEGHIKISYDSGQTWNDHGNSLGFPGDNCVHQPTFHPIDPDR